MKQTDRDIMRIALPAIVANVTIPLLGFVDLSIVGHLGDSAMIGAMSVGAMMFSLIYWNFGFLRMGTSGITAQAYGSRSDAEMRGVLLRSALLAVVIGLAIIVLQRPLRWLALLIIGPSVAVKALAEVYFDIVVWGAPAVLVTMVLKGWFLGMQNSRAAMRISILVIVLDVLASLVAVIVFGMSFRGVALGTLIAEYLGLGYGVALVVRRHRALFAGASAGEVFVWAQVKRIITVNSHIFLRSFALIIVNLTFLSIGARSGDLILAANAIIMQLYVLYSYFMDGIAFAGEALVGRYVGAGDNAGRRHCVKRLMVWGTAVAAVYVVAYALLPQYIFALLTSDARVVEVAMTYRYWCMAIPVAAMGAFVWDGIFIGQTDTLGMLVSVVTANLTFFAVYFLMPWPEGNNRLWLAFVIFLAVRGVVQTVLWLRTERRGKYI